MIAVKNEPVEKQTKLTETDVSRAEPKKANQCNATNTPIPSREKRAFCGICSDCLRNRITNHIPLAAMKVRYTTTLNAESSMSFPRMAVKPNNTMTKCSFR